MFAQPTYDDTCDVCGIWSRGALCPEHADDALEQERIERWKDER